MLGELLNILMYDTATYTHMIVEKMANSQVRLDAYSDYSSTLIRYHLVSSGLFSGD